MSRLLVVAAAAALVAAGPTLAQHAGHAGGSTASLQGPDAQRWHNAPEMHRFYDLTKTTLGRGTEGIDFPAYRQKSYAIFRDFAASHGWTPEVMVDHLKDIPAQMVQIVKEDPKVLDSYASFRDALFGPP